MCMEWSIAQRRKTYKQARQWMWSSGHRSCAYCGRRLTYRTATVDHKVLLSRGGYNKRSNYAMACAECNQEKGSKTDVVFASAMNDCS